MIVKSSREILQQARTLANADNSAYTNFFLSTTLLNNAYRDIYDKIANNSLAFSRKMTISEDTTLPGDFFAIQSVRRLPSNTLLYQRQIGGSDRDEGYEISNGIFQSSHYPVEITYIPVPATITAPDKRREVKFIYEDVGEVYVIVDSGETFYQLDGQVLSDFELISADDKEETDDGYRLDNVTFKTSTFIPTDEFSDTMDLIDNEDGTITVAATKIRKAGKYSVTKSTKKIKYNNEDITDYFRREDASISHVSFHVPYIAVSYSDGKVFIFTDNNGEPTEFAEYNYNCIYGHDTNGIAYALTTNDQTGFGMVFYDQDDEKYYYSPFVPDTILSYPTNALFTYLEYTVAFMIAGLLNMDTAFIEKQMEKAEVELFTNIGGSSNVRRINNYHAARRIWTS